MNIRNRYEYRYAQKWYKNGFLAKKMQKGGTKNVISFGQYNDAPGKHIHVHKDKHEPCTNHVQNTEHLTHQRTPYTPYRRYYQDSIELTSQYITSDGDQDGFPV